MIKPSLFVRVFILSAFLACEAVLQASNETFNIRIVLDELNKAIVTEDLNLYSRHIAPDLITGFGVASLEIVGWEKMRESLRKAWADHDHEVIKTKSQTIRVHDSGQVAWWTEVFDFSFDNKGVHMELKDVRTTGVLEKRKGQWKVVQLHSSFPAPRK